MRSARRPSYFSDDASRGLDILRLQIGVQTRAIRMGVLMVVMGCLSFAAMWFFWFVSLVETSDAFAHMTAWMALHWAGHDIDWVPVWTDAGWSRFTASQVLATGYIADSVAKAGHHAAISSLIALGLILPLAWFVIRVARARGRGVYSDRIARGTPLTDARTLSRAVARAGPSKVAICGVALPERVLNRHILLLGSTRSGKSLSIRRILREIERRGDMAVVFDKVGDFVSEFYRPDRHDLLMNPTDARSAPWSPWCEGETPIDHSRIARSLIPRRPNDRNVFFQEGARSLLVALLDRVGRMEGRSIATLLEVAYAWDRDRKKALLAGTDAAKHFIGDSDAGHDVDATMGVFAQGLRYLPRRSGGLEDRSIRAFIRDVVTIREGGIDQLLAAVETHDPETGEILSGTGRAPCDPAARRRTDEIHRLARVIGAGQCPWMFLSAETEKMDALMPLLATWIDLAVTSVLSLPPKEDRRIWFVLDEWHTLGRLTRLQDLLTEGAKYGASVLAGSQNVGQIRENYGADSAEAMLSLFNTKAVFRLPEPVSAEWASRYMGDLIWDQARESVRYGTSETMDGASIADGRMVERKVMAHEIIDLPDLTAYLSIAGAFPTARVSTTFDPKTDPARPLVAPFVARPFEDLAWSQLAPETRSAGPERERDLRLPPAPAPPFSSPANTGRFDDDPGSGARPGTPEDIGVGHIQSQSPLSGHMSDDPAEPQPDRVSRTDPSAPPAPVSGVKDPAPAARHGTVAQPDLFDPKPVAERVLELARQGRSQREIAAALEIGKTTVQRLLKGGT